MKCPKCGKELELQKRQVGTDENGQPVLNEYAICRDCKKKWNLDKKRIQKTEANIPVSETAAENKQVESASKQEDTDSIVSEQASEAIVSQKEKISAIPEDGFLDDPEPTSETQRYSNIPTDEVRTKREKVMRKSYDEMLATDPTRESTHKKKATRKKRPESDVPAKKMQKKAPETSGSSSKKVRPNESAPKKSQSAQRQKSNKPKEKKARFKVLRIILGIVSILAAVYFGVMCGLDNITQGSTSSIGFVGLILSLCLLVAGLLSICMKNFKNVLAFLLPALFCLASAIFVFIKKGNDTLLLQGTIVAAVIGLIFVILMIVSSALSNRDN
ncbi:MAG: hypothetical protein PHN80_03685 [Hespellia sp.]|nr:hypothetical protein [Hespellia sp.]